MVSREWSGRKFNWIRKQLGLSKVELARQLGISHRGLYRCVCDGASRHLLWQSSVMVSESHEGLSQELSEPEEMTRKPKVGQGDGGAKEVA